MMSSAYRAKYSLSRVNFWSNSSNRILDKSGDTTPYNNVANNLEFHRIIERNCLIPRYGTPYSYDSTTTISALIPLASIDKGHHLLANGSDDDDKTRGVEDANNL